MWPSRHFLVATLSVSAGRWLLLTASLYHRVLTTASLSIRTSGGATGAKPTCNPAVAGLDVSALRGTNGPVVAKAEQQANIVLPTKAGWHRLGCVSVGGLTNQISFFDGNKLTQDRCTESCLESGFHWAGVGNHADSVSDDLARKASKLREI